MFTRGSVAVMAAGLVLALGGCGGGTGEKADASDKRSAEPTPPRPPSKALVTWVGGMCESSRALKNLRTDSAADLKEIRTMDEGDLTAQSRAVSYLAGTPSDVVDVDRDLKDLGPSGVPAADRLLDAWQKKLKRVVPQLDEMSPTAAFDDAEGSVADADKLIQSLTPPKPDLRALTKKNPQLAAAHQRAEQCAPGWNPAEETDSPSPDPTPTGPLPKAADGKNTAACSDGKCEVLITSAADITANGLSVHVTAGDDSVTLQTPSTVMNLGGQGGVATFGDALEATVVAQNEDGAVLRFTIP
ncbi:hypothetical protein [Streptomyces sp. Rer75]|uniref:hypothetical protein n=1 Tax=unclassified Streptomyces TaxID=2593676 RepID=UPI0015D0353B|nr:hypothetical protein [Streptomyces sp. Rer75]QLH25685.1 hypothetical protein HYQ63_37965 [Streptomyces sp. Rer75]